MIKKIRWRSLVDEIQVGMKAQDAGVEGIDMCDFLQSMHDWIRVEKDCKEGGDLSNK